MRILLITAAGLLARAIEKAANEAADIEPVRLAVDDLAQIRLQEWLAHQQIAYVLVVGSEQKPIQAEVPMAMVVKACEDSNIPLIMSSSDRVFGRRHHQAWPSHAPTGPEDKKGQALVALECAVRTLEQHLIVRFGPLFGLGSGGRIEKILAGQITSWDADVRRSFTCAEDAANVLLAMLRQVDCKVEPKLWGTYHYGNTRSLSELAFGRMLHDEAKIIFPELKLASLPTLSDSAEKLRRDLDCETTLATFGIKQQPVRNWIVRCLKALLDNNQLKPEQRQAESSDTKP